MSHRQTRLSPSTRGGLFGLVAATLFGLGAPFSKLLLPACGPLLLAGLLYLGGGTSLTLFRAVQRLHGRVTEAPLSWRDWPSLSGVVLCGGLVGPVLMLLGLQRLSGLSGTLLLNLEGPFTLILALLVFREHLERGALFASLLVFGGALVIAVGPGTLMGDWLGALEIAGACGAWAVDNNLTQRLSTKDPVAVVRFKTLGAGACLAVLTLALRLPLPPPKAALGALLLGTMSYGVSVLFDVYALRLLGAAREAAYFATAPFIGAIAAVFVLGDKLRTSDFAGGIAMALGVGLLLRERHRHLHTHEALEHEHLHQHDEHHQHSHSGPVTEPHSHPHQHEGLTHEHPHVSDLHHRHRHNG